VPLSPVLRGQTVYPFVRLAQAATEVRARGVEVLDFGTGDPREPTDPRIRQALVDGVAERMGYPQAAGLPELVTHSLAQYEELAWSLATNGERLAAVRAKLERNRLTEPLFDTKRFTRDLEVAYTTMWERQQAGKPPAHFAVGS